MTADMGSTEDIAAVEAEAGDADHRAFVGPARDFDLIAGLTFSLMFALGLREHHRLLDIGCGSLRLGRLFIPYLGVGNYTGVDPNEWVVRKGVEEEVGADLIRLKQTRLVYADRLTEAEFGFDFAVAQSIFTHTGPSMLDQWLADAAGALNENGALVATFKEGVGDTPEGWTYPGFVLYTRAKMKAAAEAHGLAFDVIDWRHPRQVWAVFSRPGFDRSIARGVPSWNRTAERMGIRKRRRLGLLRDRLRSARG